jgi:hypothetical protein
MNYIQILMVPFAGWLAANARAPSSLQSWKDAPDAARTPMTVSGERKLSDAS